MANHTTPTEQEAEKRTVEHLVRVECPECHGWACYDGIPCPTCNGDGFLTVYEPAEAK